MKEFLLFPFRGKVANEDYSVFKKIAKTILGYFKMMFLWLFLMVGVVLIFELDTSNTTQKAMERMERITFYGRIFLICLFLPFLEELAFRLFLKPKKRNFMIGIGFFIFYLSMLFLTLIGEENKKIFIGILCLLLGGYFAGRNFERLKGFWTRNMIWIINIFAVIFALFHYKDYGFLENPKTAILSMSGALFIAYYASFVRLKFGFAYAVQVHCLHNTLVSLPIIIKGLS